MYGLGAHRRARACALGPHPRTGGTALALTLLVCLGIACAGCSLPGRGPSAEKAVEKFARGLSAGKPVEAGFSSASDAREYATTIAGMGGLRPRVQTGDVSAGDGKAHGTLIWHWALAGQSWSYETHVDLVERKGTDGKDSAWKVRWTPAVVERSLRSGEELSLTTVKAERGDIVGAGGTPLVTERPVLRVGLDKSRLPAGQVESSANRLAALVGVDPARLAKSASASGPRAFVQAIVYRRSEVPARVLPALAGIPGATQIADHLPLTPTREFASAILGTVGPATAETVKEGKGRVSAGDDVGLSGLEKRYDAQLSGTKGAKVVAVKDGVRRDLHQIDPVAGSALVTTLDLKLQDLAQKTLSGIGSASALVAVRPSTGDIVAAASGPGSKGYNTATYGRYAPGSTFKVVSALALLRSGMTPGSTVSCPQQVSVDGKVFKNYSDYPADAFGQISLTDALANSCNTAFISSRQEIQDGALTQAAAALGLGVDQDLGFPAYFGQVPQPTTETLRAADLIGQGQVQASPMAMATVLASVVKGGVVMPRLLPENEVSAKAPTDPLTTEEATELRTMLRAVVQRGSGRLLSSLPGPPVLAKTGTAEFGDTPPLPTHAWMIGAQGDLAVAVFVDRGQSGSGTAGPILKQYLAGAR